MTSTIADDSNDSSIPQLRVTLATVIFFKCEHTQDIIVTNDSKDIGAGDIFNCESCHAKRLVREVTNYRREFVHK